MAHFAVPGATASVLKMKVVLCVTGVSPSDKDALRVAATLALSSDAKLIFLYPFRIAEYTAQRIPPELTANVRRQAHDRFAALTSTIPILHHLDYEFVAKPGRPEDTIQSLIKKVDVCAIVVAERQAAIIASRNPFTLTSLVSQWGVPFTIAPAANKMAQHHPGQVVNDYRSSEHLTHA